MTQLKTLLTNFYYEKNDSFGNDDDDSHLCRS